MKIAVTGATGHLGTLIIDSLLAHGIPAGDITAIVRNPSKATALEDKGIKLGVADYENVSALTTALTGSERLVLVSGSEVGQRFAQHSNIVKAATTAGIQFIAYTSLLNLDTSELGLAPEHRATEELIEQSGIDFAILRNGWYWENYASAVDSGRSSGQFFGSAGTAQVSGAARQDYAEAAAIVITNTGHAGKVYELAGSPSLTYQGIADEVAKVLGKPVTYVNQTVEQYQTTLESFGLSLEIAGMFASMDPIIEKGALYSESTDLQDLIGRPSTSAAEALRN